jgi:hypothetical protein
VNQPEAREMLHAHLGVYRNRTYAELRALLGKPETTELLAPSGTTYQVEIEVHWDGRPGGALRIIGSVDDGGWRTLKPLTGNFVLAPNGTFVGE